MSRDPQEYIFFLRAPFKKRAKGPYMREHPLGGISNYDANSLRATLDMTGAYGQSTCLGTHKHGFNLSSMEDFLRAMSLQLVMEDFEGGHPRVRNQWIEPTNG